MANTIQNRFGDFERILDEEGYVLTKFLSLEEQKEISDHFKKCIHFFGGYDEAERCRAYISYLDDDFDYEIAIIQANYNKKYANITHRHVLGTIYSLGLDRSTYGDIIVDDDTITIFVSNDVKEFLINNLHEILHERLVFNEITDFVKKNINEKYIILNVASMRLDAVTAKGCNLSRNDSVELIKSGNVMINHAIITNINYQVKENDLLSIRHFGRIKINRIIGLSKKDRINLEVLINK